MRYLFLSLSALILLILNCTMSPNIPVFGVQMDFILLGLTGVVFFEDSLSSIWYSMIGVAVMDVFFARTYGFYALQYLVAVMVFYIITRKKKKKIEIYEAGLLASYLVREITGVLICFLSDNPVNLWERMLHVTLKGIVIHAILGLLIYYIYRKAYEQRLIRPTNLDID